MSTGIAAALAFRLFPNMPNDPGGGVGRLFRAGVLQLLRGGRDLAAARSSAAPVMTVSPAGLRDVRVAAEPIPWRAIKSISTWQMQRQMVLVVAIDPEEEARLTLTRLARWTRDANRRLGADGLVISAAWADGRLSDAVLHLPRLLGGVAELRLEAISLRRCPRYAPPSRQHAPLNTTKGRHAT